MTGYCNRAGYENNAAQIAQFETINNQANRGEGGGGGFRSVNIRVDFVFDMLRFVLIF